jgi:TrbC/VIRB2 family pilin
VEDKSLMQKTTVVIKSAQITCRHRWGFVNLGVYLALLPLFACADVVSTLNDFLLYLTGPLGKVVATLAIVGVGFACFVMGRLPKSAVLAVVVGIGLIFGASAMLSMLTG